MRRFAFSLPLLLLAAAAPAPAQQPNRGDYRFPAIYGQRIVLTSEGDLWEVATESHWASWSPDGKWIYFHAATAHPVIRRFDGRAVAPPRGAPVHALAAAAPVRSARI